MTAVAAVAGLWVLLLVVDVVARRWFRPGPTPSRRPYLDALDRTVARNRERNEL